MFQKMQIELLFFKNSPYIINSILQQTIFFNLEGEIQYFNLNDSKFDDTVLQVAKKAFIFHLKS